MYDARKIITKVVDFGSWFEIGALWGTTAIVGLGRLCGRPVGIISLNCEVNAGSLDAAGSQKLTRHLEFCDIFNIPVVQFVDVPGYAIGTIAKRTATMRNGVALGTTYFCHNAGLQCCDSEGGGIEVGHAAELKALPPDQRAARHKELEEEYLRLMNPVRTANAFGVEEIIDPAVTIQVIAEWTKHMCEEILPTRLLDRANGKIKPMFY